MIAFVTRCWLFYKNFTRNWKLAIRRIFKKLFFFIQKEKLNNEPLLLTANDHCFQHLYKEYKKHLFCIDHLNCGVYFYAITERMDRRIFLFRYAYSFHKSIHIDYMLTNVLACKKKVTLAHSSTYIQLQFSLVIPLFSASAVAVFVCEPLCLASSERIY